MSDTKNILTDADYEAAADIISCNPEVIKAVAKVESGPLGAFGPDGRCVIRFEVHKFHDFMGANNKANSAVFAMAFKYMFGKPWTGHLVKLPGDAVWNTPHLNQAREWATFEYARTIKEQAAMKSISMGMFQIMGFNYALAGYDTVQAFFNDHVTSAALQLQAFARFCVRYRNLAKHLQNLDWENFALEYNGDGKYHDYATKLKDAYGK